MTKVIIEKSFRYNIDAMEGFLLRFLTERLEINGIHHFLSLKNLPAMEK